MDKPIIAVNHAARAWTAALTTFGIFAEMLQHAAPELQRLFPDIKWIAPAIMLVGFVWSTVQKVQDALKQASEQW